MHADQATYRELYNDVAQGDRLFAGVLLPWLDRQKGERGWLAEFAKRDGDPIPPALQEELWRLYALSRVMDLLESLFVSSAFGFSSSTPITLEEFQIFAHALGMQPLTAAEFHPFFHEIVAVDQLPDADAPPTLVEAYYLGHRLGPLLISRTGYRIEAGRNHIVKEVAEDSTLYWAHARSNRKTEDLSVGWGHNSQWRTDFRRDYNIGGFLHYNVDAKGQRDDREPDLSESELLELLKHRSFVTCDKRSDDRWPYDLNIVEKTPPNIFPDGDSA